MHCPIRRSLHDLALYRKDLHAPHIYAMLSLAVGLSVSKNVVCSGESNAAAVDDVSLCGRVECFEFRTINTYLLRHQIAWVKVFFNNKTRMRAEA